MLSRRIVPRRSWTYLPHMDAPGTPDRSASLPSAETRLVKKFVTDIVITLTPSWFSPIARPCTIPHSGWLRDSGNWPRCTAPEGCPPGVRV